MKDKKENSIELENSNLILKLTTQIVSAYVSYNCVDSKNLPELIQKVTNSLCDVAGNEKEAFIRPLEPAVPINKSVTPDYIICLEDGKKLKMMKRHLKLSYNLTPEEYRTRWGLPENYPMSAPSYSKKRSEMARNLGLGKSTGKYRRNGSKKKS